MTNDLNQYPLRDFMKELDKELSMRRKVWKSKTGKNFLMAEHQRRYDVLEELYLILVHTPLTCFEEMRLKAESAMNIIARNPELF